MTEKCSCISCFSGGSYSSFCPCSAVPSSPVFCMLPGLLFPVYWWGPPLDLVSHGKLSIKWIFKEDAHVHFFSPFCFCSIPHETDPRLHIQVTKNFKDYMQNSGWITISKLGLKHIPLKVETKIKIQLGRQSMQPEDTM